MLSQDKNIIKSALNQDENTKNKNSANQTQNTDLKNSNSTDRKGKKSTNSVIIRSSNYETQDTEKSQSSSPSYNYYINIQPVPMPITQPETQASDTEQTVREQQTKNNGQLIKKPTNN